MNSAFPIRYVPGPHEKVLLERVGAEGVTFTAADAASVRERVDRTLILCFTNRSGSNLLAECLDAAGLTNTAGEFLNEDVVRNHSVAGGHRTLGAYLAALARVQTPPTGTFAIKLGWHQLFFLARLGYLDEMLPNPRFVHVTRIDRVAQAISLFIAARTGAWTSGHAATRETADSVAFDGPLITEIVADLCASDAQFETFFAVRGCTATHVVYEDLAEDPLTQVRRVAVEQLGLVDASRLSLDAAKLHLERQSNETNARLEAAFRSAYGR